MSLDRFWFCIDLAKLPFCITLQKPGIKLNRNRLHLIFTKCLCTNKYLWLQIEPNPSTHRQVGRYVHLTCLHEYTDMFLA